MRFTRFLFSSVGGLLLGSSLVASAQITPSQDAYTNSAKPSTNFGTAPTLGVANSAASIQSAYIKFDLSAIPVGYTGANIAKASLKLYVNGVTTAGSFNVDYIVGSWSESTITANLAPALGGTIVSSESLTTSSKNDYVVIDLTSALQAWLNGTQTNDGIALVANSPLSATFDSKENSAQSHPAELDVVFNGAITGITTASGSGLMGGGTSGNLSLALTNTCATNQVLQWNGSAWTCSAAAGGGTVSSVGLTAPSSDFVVTGSPVTNSGTLGLNWNVVPTDSNTANAIVKRRSDGGFDAGGTINVGFFNASTVSASTISASFSLSSPYLTSPIIVAGGNGSNWAVEGTQSSGSVPAIYGNTSVNGTGPGVEGDSYYGVGVNGYGSTYVGVQGTGPTGVAGGAFNGGDGVYGEEDSGTGYAGYFLGNVGITGTLSKSGGSFKIDHPLDPANKYLYHSFVESPDMMNIYNGNTTTDAQGDATIQLPAWFERLNRDFRYQLTVLGQFAQAIVATEIVNSQFAIKTDKPNVKVSWQVTGIRQDAWANAHRIPVEEEKAEKDRGFYLHPELFGEPMDKTLRRLHPNDSKMHTREADANRGPDTSATARN